MLFFSLTNKMTRRLAVPAAFATLFLFGGVTSGCGGGGGGGNNNQQAALTTTETRAATVRVVKQTRALPTILGSLGSGLANADRSVTRAKSFPTIVGLLRAGAGKTRQTSAIQYDPTLNLYYSTTEGTTSYRLNFFSDAAGTQDAGNVTVNLVSASSAVARFNVTGGNIPLTGTLTLKPTSDDGIKTTGTVRLTRTGESISPNLTTDADGTSTGTITVADTSGTIRYLNVNAQSNGRFQSDLEYRDATGTTYQGADGAGRVMLRTKAHEYDAVYDVDGAGTLAFSNSGTSDATEPITDFDLL